VLRPFCGLLLTDLFQNDKYPQTKLRLRATPASKHHAACNPENYRFGKKAYRIYLITESLFWIQPLAVGKWDSGPKVDTFRPAPIFMIP